MDRQIEHTINSTVGAPWGPLGVFGRFFNITGKLLFLFVGFPGVGSPCGRYLGVSGVTFVVAGRYLRVVGRPRALLQASWLSSSDVYR